MYRSPQSRHYVSVQFTADNETKLGTCFPFLLKLPLSCESSFISAPRFKSYISIRDFEMGQFVASPRFRDSHFKCHGHLDTDDIFRDGRNLLS